MSKKALITGAGSGIGRDIAKVLSSMGYEIIMVSRSTEKMHETAKQLKTKSYIIPADLSDRNKCIDIYKEVQEICTDGELEIVINNAGFGLFGRFCESDINTELKMIDTNIVALHILTKLFLNNFISKNSGYILNVASSAAFMPGPLMAAYYSTKAYVLRLSLAVDRELKKTGSNVYIGVLCPGPVDTNFNNVANVKFALKGLSSEYVAEYAIKKMLKRKTVIVPGLKMKLGKFILRFAPDSLATEAAYNIQRRKN